MSQINDYARNNKKMSEQLKHFEGLNQLRDEISSALE